jgi:hypothetical protein
MIRSLSRIALATVTMVSACLVVEVATRMIDGYRVWSTHLVRVHPGVAPPSDAGKWMDPQQAGEYVSRLPIAVGVRREWFTLDPKKPTAPPIDPELERRYWTGADNELPSVYEWNLEFVRRVVCNGERTDYPYLAAQFRRLTDAFVFESPDGTPYPTYRFLRNARYPSGLVTNSFGWRGADLPLNKPNGRIRVAFVGASTTLDAHGDPFSYPEYIGRWLNAWANERFPSVSFDVINAGREGVLSNSIAAIVKQEVLPLRPDLIVYYEGANQFWPADFVSRPVIPVLRLLRVGPVVGRYSAMAVRIQNLLDRPGSGAEPPKPALPVAWPADLNESDPPLGDHRLPVQLPQILRDLETIRKATTAIGGTLVPSSFMWLVSPGLTLDPGRDAIIYRELNQRYWPFSYAHMRRFVDFENRVFRKFAHVHGLPFNDLASEYPADQRLFVDSIHMTPAGVKLKAWVVFQNLLPVIEQRLRAGTLPSGDPGGRQTHPAFTDSGRRLLPIERIVESCP